ncbi:MAG: hypothetical protein WKF84_12320 [Pyrinomonadaceae bacterium]
MDAGGVKTETRTFRGESGHVERVVVTTREGKRTRASSSRSGEAKDLPESDVERAFEATGDALGTAAGFVVDKSKDAASAAKEGLERLLTRPATSLREPLTKPEAPPKRPVKRQRQLAKKP